MNIGLFVLVMALLAGVCASVWAACAHWLRAGPIGRLLPAAAVPIAAFWVLNTYDDLPFGVIGFLQFLVPLLLVEAGTLVFLENRRARKRS